MRVGFHTSIYLNALLSSLSQWIPYSKIRESVAYVWKTCLQVSKASVYLSNVHVHLCNIIIIYVHYYVILHVHVCKCIRVV